MKRIVARELEVAPKKRMSGDTAHIKALLDGLEKANELVDIRLGVLERKARKIEAKYRLLQKATEDEGS